MTNAERAKLWRERNAARVQAYERARSQRRVEARQDYRVQWFAEHPGARARWNATRKRRVGSASNVGKDARRICWIRQMGECGLCGTGMGVTEFDHIIPLCKGGPHSLENVHLVHPECNRAKGRKRIEELATKET